MSLRITSFVLVGALTLARMAAAQEQDQRIHDMQLAADSWLEDLDAGDLGRCWEQSAEVLRDSLALDDLDEAMRQVRAHLADDGVQTADPPEREVLEAGILGNVAGLPDGEYGVIRYRFRAGDRRVLEALTLRLEENVWRVAGYVFAPE